MLVIRQGAGRDVTAPCLHSATIMSQLCKKYKCFYSNQTKESKCQKNIFPTQLFRLIVW